MAQAARALVGRTPKADDLTDGFENVDDLILCSHSEKGWLFLGGLICNETCLAHIVWDILD